MSAIFLPRNQFLNPFSLDWCQEGSISINSARYPFWREDPPGSGEAYFGYVIDLGDNTHSGYTDRGVSFVCGFPDAESVLISKYQGQNNSVHVSFDPPVSAVGARVGGDGAMDFRFFATLEVALDTGVRVPIQTPNSAPFTRAPGAAPFVGATPIAAGTKIRDAWFDLKVDANVVPARARCDWIGVGTLLFMP